MLHLFGIRHHGPGCARSLVQGLDELQPDVIILEAPADLEPVLPMAGHAELQPPVAMMLYARDQPGTSVVYPLAAFSPEWQVLCWATQHHCPVRAMDLPMSIRMALDAQPAESSADSTTASSPVVSSRVVFSRAEPAWRADPLAILADAAGYQDHELWWEEQIERREDATGVFEAILHAMRAVREEFPEANEKDLLREAHMRKTIRQVIKEGFQNIAVVCGAWHTPCLDQSAIEGKQAGCRISDDNARLRSLPKLKTTATWIPWTHSRLAYRSGYGAGIEAPGWYAHVWESQREAPLRWLVNGARLLREKDLAASSASIIEALRLAEALAAMRDIRSPGLRELNESILTVFCQGESSRFELVRKRLEMGDRLGAVPSDIISVPLLEDVQRLQKSLRLKPAPHPRAINLDLRNDHARQQSRFLHRLLSLGVDWGEKQPAGQGISTFHELWKLDWQPEFAITLIEANVWGNTLTTAASARMIHQSEKSVELQDMARLLDMTILADLPDVIPFLIQRLQAASAVSAEILQLMSALVPLARVFRYGDVRGTDVSQLEPIIRGMVNRICIALPVTCANVSQELGEQIVAGLVETQQGLSILQLADLNDEFHQVLQNMIRTNVHGLIRGWSTRNLLEQQLLDEGALELLASQALGPAIETAQAAAWIQGLLQGSGLLLMHQEIVWRVMDRWLLELPESTFVELLPVLRRAFSNFSHAERRQMGEKIKHFETDSMAPHKPGQKMIQRIDEERAARVLPVLAQILGVGFRGEK